MELKRMHWIGIGISIILIVASFFLYGTRFFFFVFGLGILSAVTPFVLFIIMKTRVAAEKEDMFLEFSRNLVERCWEEICISSG